MVLPTCLAPAVLLSQHGQCPASVWLGLLLHLLSAASASLCVQVRICTRMGVEMKSTDFRSQSYYINLRKAITAGFFMQVGS